MGPLIPLFWTSGDVFSGFQSLSGQPYLHFVQAYMLHVPWDLPLVPHLLISWWPAWQPSHSHPHTCEQALVGLETGIYHAPSGRPDRLSYAGMPNWSDSQRIKSANSPNLVRFFYECIAFSLNFNCGKLNYTYVFIVNQEELQLDPWNSDRITMLNSWHYKLWHNGVKFVGPIISADSYRPPTKLQMVIFLQVSVSHSEFELTPLPPPAPAAVSTHPCPERGYLLPLPNTWTRDTTEYGWQASGTHPTGLLSC